MFIKKYIKRAVKCVGLDVILPINYSRAKKKPLQHRVLFVSRTGDCEISDNYRLLADHIKKVSDYEISSFSLKGTTSSFFGYSKRAVRLAREVATSEIVFVDDANAIISALPLRSETKIFNVWHACGAFKKFGMSTADKLFGGSRKEKLRHPFYENLCGVSVSSPEVVDKYVEAMALEESADKVVPLGISRTDTFFDDNKIEKAKGRLRSQIPGLGTRKVILYAPTFRGRVNSATSPDSLDMAKMKKELSSDYVLLIKRHPFVKDPTSIDASLSDFVFDVTDKFDINDSLMAANVCITDYSSLIFEYSLLDRPLIFYCFDKDEYDDWRGFYYDYDEITPGPKCFDTESVIEAIKQCPEDPYSDIREVFKERFMSSCDGHSTERIWDYVINFNKESLSNN